MSNTSDVEDDSNEEIEVLESVKNTKDTELSSKKVTVTRSRSYTIEEKLTVIRRLRSEKLSLHQLSRDTGIDRKRLREWRDKEDKLSSATKKRERRQLPGPGRKPFYPEIDEAFLKYFREEREKRHSVTYTDLRKFFLSDKFPVPKPPGFKVSNKYLFLWTRRNNISPRKITHHGQIEQRTLAEVKRVMVEYFEDLRQKTAGIPENRIVNMDEVPCYFDMARDTTLSFRGAKNVDGADTGYRKQRYTVAISVTMDGRSLKPMVIFRGLKKIPNVQTPNNKIVVKVSKSGSMDSGIAKEWMDSVFSGRGPYFHNTESVLIWDSYGSHKREDVVDYLKKKYKSKIVLVPAKTTCMAQPLDVLVNSSFKAALKNEWAAWIRDSPAEFTPAGYRKRPSYQAIIDMVSLAMDSVQSDTIKKAFEVCGIGENGREVPLHKLNERLQKVLNCDENPTGGLCENLPSAQDDDDDGIGADSGDEVLVERDEGEEMSDDEEEF